MASLTRIKSRKVSQQGLQRVIGIKEPSHDWVTSSLNSFLIALLHLTLAPNPGSNPPSHVGPGRRAPLSAEKSVMTASVFFLNSSSVYEKSQATIRLSYSLFWALFFSWFLISSAQSQCLLPLCSQHGQDERFCHYFPYITNHKAALPHSLIASVSRLIVSNHQRHIWISSLCVFSSIPANI